DAPEMRHGQCAQSLDAEVGPEHGAAEADEAALRVQRQLDRGEVAVTYQHRIRASQPLAQCVVVQVFQQARGTVAAADRQCDVGQRVQRGERVEVGGTFDVAA